MRKNPNVKFRFNAQSHSGLQWIVDDVYINAWPAVTSASFTYLPASVEANANISFTASYTSIDTSLPITYTWNFCGSTQNTTSPTITHVFSEVGDCLITLAVQNPYDSANSSQTVYINPAWNQLILTVNVTPHRRWVGNQDAQ